jgi:tetratricopeptide (TPR) repeat protein
VEECDRRTLELVIRLAPSMYLLGRFQDTVDLLLQQCERLERLQEPVLTGPWAFWLSHIYTYQGNQAGAEQIAQRAIEAAQHCGDEATLGKAHYVLARVGCWLCRFPQGIVHGQQAIALLERTGEQWWLGHAHWMMGLMCYLMGEFPAALEAVARARAVGEAIGDPRIPHYSGWTSGIVHATRGDWEQGVALCQHSLDHSKDSVNTAASLGYLGSAYLEQGDAARAIPLLEESVRQWSQFQFRPGQGWFAPWLSEALFLDGQLDKAREVAYQGLALSRDCRFWYGVGMAQRVLGHIAQSTGAFAEAAHHFQEALETLTSIQSRFEAGRTHLDLGALAQAQGHQEAAATHLHAAHAMFTALQVPRYGERTAQLAGAHGVTLAVIPS